MLTRIRIFGKEGISKRFLAIFLLLVFSIQQFCPVFALDSNFNQAVLYNHNKSGNVLSSLIGNNKFADYTYTNNKLSSITYGNGQTVSMNFNGDSKVSDIFYDTKPAFSYEYSNYGEIGLENDYITGRKTTNKDDYFLINSFYNNAELFSVLKTHQKTHNIKFGGSNYVTRTISDLTDSTEINYKNEYFDITIENRFDDYNRLTFSNISNDDFTCRTNFIYSTDQSNSIKTEQFFVFTSSDTYSSSTDYQYDNNNNICEIDVEQNGIHSLSEYRYNSIDELVFVDDNNMIKTFEYDKHGNIKRIKCGKINHNFKYDDEQWPDKLTSYDSNDIVYDEVGNPISYHGNSYGWLAGRRLERFSNERKSVRSDYCYDAFGHRTKKNMVIDGLNVRYSYFWSGDALLAMTVENISGKSFDTVIFLYDECGNPFGFIKNLKDVYFYLKDKNNSITAIFNNYGMVASYKYDEFGKIVSKKESDDKIKLYNPFYYRGYLYDIESNMYYLISRYYVPEWGRFLNADSFFDTGVGNFSDNMFAYCDNNPINNSDPFGFWKMDGHKLWTTQIANSTSLSAYASQIGQGSWDVDDDMSTNPFREPVQWRYNQRFHFDRRNYCNNVSNGEDTRVYYANRYISDAISEKNRNNLSGAANLLGRALHFTQDISAHGNVGLNSSVAVHGLYFDDIDYIWKTSERKSVKKGINGDRSRYDETMTDTAVILALYSML